jgi:plastocyanin
MQKRLACALVVLVLAGAACSSNEKTPSAGGTTGGSTPSASPSFNDHGSKTVAGMQSLELELDNFYFEPTTLKGSAGQKLTLELKNESMTLHSFTLTEQSIDKDVQPEKSETVTVTFPASGSVVFYCKYHRASGMQGSLVTS